MPDSGQSAKGRRSVMIGVQVLFGVLLLAAVVQGLWLSTENQGNTFNLPHEIAGVEAVRVLTGPEAMAAVSELHGKDVGLVNGYVGYYQYNAMVWVGEAQSEQEAQRLIEAMTRKIQAGNPMFTNLQRSEVDGQPLFSVTGDGQRHYYFQRGARVVWVTPPTSSGTEFLRAALKLLQ